MKTVVIGPRPAELDVVIARRRALGQDGYDEVWEGDYHMAPMAHPWHGRLGLTRHKLGSWSSRDAELVGFGIEHDDMSKRPVLELLAHRCRAGTRRWYPRISLRAACGVHGVGAVLPSSSIAQRHGRRRWRSGRWLESCETTHEVAGTPDEAVESLDARRRAPHGPLSR